MNLFAHFKQVLLLMTVMAGLVMHSSANAYSYAAAGKEPLIEGRELILSAVADADYTAVESAVNGLKEEFDYLLSDHGVDLYTPMSVAIKSKNGAVIESIIDQAIVEEIIRRLDGAEQNLNDYQVAKVLVVKSKLFLDLIMPKLDDENRKAANQAVQGVLVSIGNPGVFGVGQAPADAAMFTEQRSVLLDAIKGLKQH